MSTRIYLLTLLLAMLANKANCYCKFGQEPPKVSVANSTHLFVSWKDAFKDCEDSQIDATDVRIENRRFPQIHYAKEAKVQANPCLRHDVMVTLDMKDMPGQPSTVWSQVTHYNADLKMESIYSGLLQEKFSEEICAKRKSGFQIPEILEIPDGIKDCVFKDNIRRDGPHRFTIPIVKPNGLRGRSDIVVDCEQTKIRTNPVHQSGNKQTNNHMFIVLFCSSFFVALIVIITAMVVYRKCVLNKKKNEAKAEVNPDYAGAADYEYDDMGNYDSIEVVPKKKEVKAEVVDRSSIYGKKEEGWEDAVAVDTNS